MNESIKYNLTKKQIRLGKIAFFLVIALAYSYPITVIISNFTKLDSHNVSIFFRAIWVFISIRLIIGALFQKNGLKIKLGGRFLMIFAAIYSLRLLYDIFYKGIIFNDDLFFTLSMSFGNCILPFIAISLTSKYINLTMMAKYVFYFVLLSAISIIVFIFSDLQTNIIFLFSSRFGLEVINPITISSIGGTLFLVSIALLLNKQINNKKHLAIGIVIGLFLLVLGASRGPLIFTILVLAILLIVHFRNIGLNWNSFRLGFLIFIVISSVFVFLIPYFEHNDFAILGRMDSFVENRKTGQEEERNSLFQSAWSQFTDHPILGDSYLEKTSKFYPHNLTIEAFMATGIIGSFFYLSTLIITLIKMDAISRLKNSGYCYIYLVCFSLTILMCQTSGSFLASIELWVFWPLILNGNFYYLENDIRFENAVLVKQIK